MKIVSLSLVLLLLPLCLHAAQVKAVKGKVRVGLKILKPGSILKQGDRIKTGKKSTVVITINNDTIKVNENSVLVIQEASSKAEKIAQITLQLDSGSLFSKVRTRKKKGDYFRVKTPSAVAGVRGTQFFTSYASSSSKTKDMWMCVKEGKVELKNLNDNRSVLVKEGEGVVITSKGKMSDPEPVPWTQKLNWNMDGDIENKASVEDSYREKVLDQDYD